MPRDSARAAHIAQGPRRRGARAQVELGVHARALELSTAAISLGEIREELADLVFTGLVSVTARRVEPIAVRLGELGLAKQAELLRQAAAKPDAADRLDDVVKLHQVLDIALARLVGAAQIDREQLAASPLFASVYVRKQAEVLEPIAIARKLTRGEVNRFEAAALAGRYYETLPPASLIEQVFPIWADGAASQYIALAARAHPTEALAAACGLLLQPAAKSGSVQRVRRPRNPRMASITALRVLEALGSDDARAVLRAVANGRR